MLRASLSNSTNEQLEEAKKDFIPYLTHFSARLLRPEEVEAWAEASVEQNERGVPLVGSGWEANREAAMKRVNPKFVLRQWVLEELIAKLEKSGVGRIEDGRKDLAKVLDVSLPNSRTYSPCPCTASIEIGGG